MTDRACASAADAAAGPVTVSPAPHLPFLDPLQVKPPALSPLDPAEWVEIDAAYAPQMALRDRLLAGEPDRFAAVLREGADALEELTDLLAAHLAARGYVRRADRLRRLDGVEIDLTPTPVTLGRLSQEDWLILMPPDGTGEYRLVGGALVFPAGWSLGDKIGRPLTAVHAPVPGYAEGLAPRVNRIFAAAHPDRPLV
ncbi:MAG: heme-dependent oxidative N-demethylase subunit alpha family protein, partial [Pseudomonadota bacterium]